jgi:hypothetical protein
MKKILFALFIIGLSTTAFSQTYNDNVSKDSVLILNKRVEALKNNMKLLDLKLQEAEEEDAVDKLKIKLFEANETAKLSAQKLSNNGDKNSSSIDVKKSQKLSKQAKNDADDASKALDRLNKQMEKVEGIRSKIKVEELKVNLNKPVVLFKEN